MMSEKQRQTILQRGKPTTLWEGEPRLGCIYGDEEIEAAVEAMRRAADISKGVGFSGYPIPEFEQAFAEYVGAEYAVALNSAGPGPDMAMRKLDLQSGDEVIVQAVNFVAAPLAAPPAEADSKEKHVPTPKRAPADAASDKDASPPIESLHTDELIMAVRAAFNTGVARDRDTAIRDTARKLGCRRAGANIQATLDKAIRKAVRRGVVYNDGGLLHADCRSITDYAPDDLVKHLCSAMGRMWWEQEELIYAAAHYLGFRRIGPDIRKILKNALAAGIRRGLIERDHLYLHRL